jgi:hypothetical protein
MRQHTANFANFICRFGEERVLLDCAESIVLPAFTDDTLIRTYGTTRFFIYEAKVEVIEQPDEPLIVVSGRFVKEMNLSREQIFDPEQGIVRSEASIESAPSAFFALILNNHRLVYFPETAHAPDLKNFQSTILSNLKVKHKTFINKLYNEAKENDARVTKKELFERNPSPTLEIVPISGDGEIEAFIRRYEVLKKIEFKIYRTNDEIDAEEIFNDLRGFLNPMNPSDVRMQISNNNGLDLNEAVPRVQAATETANQDVKLVGLDSEGNKLTGDNHEFKVSTPIEPIPPTRNSLLEKLLGAFSSLKDSGVIKTGERAGDVRAKILDLVQKL